MSWFVYVSADKIEYPITRYLNTYIALCFRTPELPVKRTKTNGDEFPSLINARSPVS